MTRGAYVLIIEFLAQGERTREGNNSNTTLVIGRLGSVSFRSGYYCYVGSAMGGIKSSTNLQNRIKRHLRSFYCPEEATNKPKKHWHIDYLLSHRNSRIVAILIIPSREKEECRIAAIVKNRANGMVSGFGCSDCGCGSHLFYFKQPHNIPTYRLQNI